MFGEREGMDQCSACKGTGRTTLGVGSVTEDTCVCDDEHFSTRIDTADVACEPCPDHATCTAGGLPRPEPGYWLDLADPSSPPDQMVPCTPSEACQGRALVKTNVSAACVMALRSRNEEKVGRWCEIGHRLMGLDGVLREPLEQCTPGYVGVRCSACAVGYYRFSGEFGQ